ncbi:MAG: metalloregulator ArsR/SmtB family transcription factor [Erysipelotrichales bacterium]
MKDFQMFKMLGDENRLRLIVLLLDREVCMTHLYIGLDLKQSNTSRILKILSENGIVSARTKGNNRYYKVCDKFRDEYKDIIEYIGELKLKEEFIEDANRMKAVKNCGCVGQCECII